MKRSVFWFAAGAMALLAAAEAGAQRRIPGRPPRAPEAPPAPPPEEKPAPRGKVERWVAITGGDVHVGTGQVLRRAAVVLADDKIHAVGHDVEIPEDAEVIDASGKVVAPGFVAVQARGMGAPGSPRGKYADSVDAFDPSIMMALAAGITTYCVWSGGGGSIGGQSAIIKLVPRDVEGMVVKEPAVHVLSVPLGSDDWRKLRELLEQCRTWMREHEEFQQKKAAGDAQAREPRKPQGADPMLSVLKGESRLFVTSRRGGGAAFFGAPATGGFDVTAIREALEVARLIGRGVVLVDPTEGWVVPDEIARSGSMAVVSPRSRVRVREELGRPNGSNIAMAAILREAGVPVAVTPPGGMGGGPVMGTGGILGRDLHTPHVDAAFAVRGGLDNRQALRTLTLDAAEILGVADRVGSLEPGKDADVLILDGAPLHYRTFVETAVVNGKVVYERDKATFFAHIRR